MNLKLTIWCWLFFMASTRLYSYSDTLGIGKDFKEISIQHFGKVFLTKKANLSIDSIRSLPSAAFQSLELTGNTFSPSDNRYWFKSIIKNESDTLLRLILEIRNPFLNYIQFYEVRQQHLKTSIPMGDDFVFSQRIIDYQNYLYPLEIKAGETVEIFAFMRKIGESMMIKGSLWQAKEFHMQGRRSAFSFTLFVGFLACISFFLLLVFLMTRQRLLFYFLMYVVACTLSILLALGYGFMYLWPNVPHINDLGYLFLQVYFLSLIALTRSYLNSKEHTPKLDKALRLAQFLFVAFIPAAIFNQHLPLLIKTALTNIAHVYYLAVITCIILTVIVIFRKQKSNWILLFLFGFLFGMVALSLFAFEYQGWVNNYWSVVITMILITIDFTILMLVIGHQIRLSFLKNIILQQELGKNQLMAANILLEGQRIERQRLSEELHHGISIKLGLLRLKLSKVLKSHPEEKSLIENVGNIANEIRDFTHAISPFNTKNQSLQEAIETLIYDVEEQTAIHLELDLAAFDEQKLAPKGKEAVFQTLQELLNNSIKHSEASTIDISIKNKRNRFYLTFQDNGKGFDVHSQKMGIGLKTIRSRAQLLGGNFTIQSGEHGSQFEFSYPIA